MKVDFSSLNLIYM